MNISQKKPPTGQKNSPQKYPILDHCRRCHACHKTTLGTQKKKPLLSLCPSPVKPPSHNDTHPIETNTLSNKHCQPDSSPAAIPDHNEVNQLPQEFNNPRSLKVLTANMPFPKILKDPDMSTGTTSPPSSPVKKKTHPDGATQPNTHLQEVTVNEKKPEKRSTTKKSKNTQNKFGSVLKPSNYDVHSLNSQIYPLSVKTTCKYVHKHQKILVELGIDFSKDALSQFESNNGKKVVFSKQQLVLTLGICDKSAPVIPIKDTDLSSPPLEGSSGV